MNPNKPGGISILRPYHPRNLTTRSGMTDRNAAYGEGVIDSLGGMPVMAVVTQLVRMAIDQHNLSADDGERLTPTNDEYARAASYVVAALQLSGEESTTRKYVRELQVQPGVQHVATLAAAVEALWDTPSAHLQMAALSDEEFSVVIELVRQGQHLAAAMRTAKALCAAAEPLDQTTEFYLNAADELGATVINDPRQGWADATTAADTATAAQGTGEPDGQ